MPPSDTGDLVASRETTATDLVSSSGPPIVGGGAAGAIEAKTGNASAPGSQPTPDFAGTPVWFAAWFQEVKDSIGQALTDAVDLAAAAAYAPCYNLTARSSNRSAMGLSGRPLVALQNAKGMVHPAFPKTTDALAAWRTQAAVGAGAWAALHDLLRHYGVPDPITSRPFVAAGEGLPPLPRAARALARFRRRVAAFEAFIQH